MTTKVKNIITGFQWDLDDEHAIMLVKKHPYDFEIVEATEEVKKAIIEPKITTQEEKLLGIKKPNFESMNFNKLKAYCLENNIDIKGLKSKEAIIEKLKEV